MNYAAQLARLEKLAGKGGCPSCRLYRRHTWLDSAKKRPSPEDTALHAASVCDLCGATSNTDLSGYAPEHREIMRLLSAAKLEETFTIPRVWAAEQWMLKRSVARSYERKVRREMQRMAAPTQTPYAQQQRNYAQQQQARAREQAKAKDPDFKLYKKLLVEAHELGLRRYKRLERQYGKHPFPELDARLATVQSPDYDQMYKGEPYEHDVHFSPMYELEREAKAWLMCAELEKIILGEVSAHTAGKIAHCEQQAREMISAAQAKHEAREEERRKREEERQKRLAPRESAPDGSTPDRDLRSRRAEETQPAVAPLTAADLRLRLEARCAHDPTLFAHNLSIFNLAQAQGDEERMMNLAGVSEEEKRRRGFLWQRW